MWGRANARSSLFVCLMCAEKNKGKLGLLKSFQKKIQVMSALQDKKIPVNRIKYLLALCTFYTYYNLFFFHVLFYFPWIWPCQNDRSRMHWMSQGWQVILCLKFIYIAQKLNCQKKIDTFKKHTHRVQSYNQSFDWR